VVAGPQGLTSFFVLESCGYSPGLDNPERVGELKLSKDEGFSMKAAWDRGLFFSGVRRL
jgi:hypothetical protein